MSVFAYLANKINHLYATLNINYMSDKNILSYNICPRCNTTMLDIKDMAGWKKCHSCRYCHNQDLKNKTMSDYKELEDLNENNIEFYTKSFKK